MKLPVILKIVGGLLLCLVAFAILFPVFAEAKIGGGPSCPGHLRNIYNTLSQYAANHDGRLPGEKWITALEGTGTTRIYDCRKVEHPGQWGFAMNVDYLGAKLKEIKNPEKAVLIFETDALAKDAVANLAALSTSRHGKQSPALFADGKVRMLPGKDKP